MKGRGSEGRGSDARFAQLVIGLIPSPAALGENLATVVFVPLAKLIAETVIDVIGEFMSLFSSQLTPTAEFAGMPLVEDAGVTTG
jgi:hypothetical protein